MSYHKHMVTVSAGEDSNYLLTCVCGARINVASTSDEFAAESAFHHVKDANAYEQNLTIIHSDDSSCPCLAGSATD
jgi:hypothetical protein